MPSLNILNIVPNRLRTLLMQTKCHLALMHINDFSLQAVQLILGN